LMRSGGGLAGNMAARVTGSISGVARNVRSQLDEYGKRVLQKGEEAGLVFTPGQKQGSESLQQLEASLRSSPAFSGIDEARIAGNQTRLNELVAENMGRPGQRITPELRADVADEVGEVFDNLGKNVESVNIADEAMSAVLDDLSEAGEGVYNRLIKRYPSLNTGNMTGKDWSSARNWLAKQSRNTANIQSGASDDITQIINAMDDGLAQSAPEIAEQLGRARQQWKGLLLAEGGLRGATAEAAGDVSPAALAQTLRKLDKGGYSRGRTDSPLYDAIRAQNFTADVVGNSGTATREYLMNRGVKQALIDKAMYGPLQTYMQGGPLSGLMAGGIMPPQALDQILSQTGYSTGKASGLLD